MAKGDDPDIERLKEELRRIREVVRPMRIEQIIREECRGSPKAFAERIGKQDNYVSRMRSDKTGRKNVGEETAFIIESRFNKPRGWLDRERDESPAAKPPVCPLLSEDAIALASAWLALREPLRSQIRLLVMTLAAMPASVTKHLAAGTVKKRMAAR